MVGFETASYENSTKHYKENQPWNTFGCTIPVILDEVSEERREAIFQQGWNKRGSLDGLIELVNGKAVKNV